jgi:hypothetical protein
VGAASAASLGLFFVMGPPFGLLNDLGNAALGVCSAALARSLIRVRGGSGLGTPAAAGSAGLGAALTVVGSALVTSGATGFFLAGLVSSVGFALIGVWLVALSGPLRTMDDGPAPTAPSAWSRGS